VISCCSLTCASSNLAATSSCNDSNTAQVRCQRLEGCMTMQ
jgi:hypothetical protein